MKTKHRKPEQLNVTKTNPGLVTSYNNRPGNNLALFKQKQSPQCPQMAKYHYILFNSLHSQTISRHREENKTQVQLLTLIT